MVGILARPDLGPAGVYGDESAFLRVRSSTLALILVSQKRSRARNDK